MKALITGITGFAGSHLAEHLLARGDEVVGCARHENWAFGAEHLAERVELLTWDIGAELDASTRQRIVEFAPDAIYHLAAISVPGACGADEPTGTAMAVNVDGTRRVAELAAALPCPSRVLFASSCYVYAPLEDGQVSLDEDSPIGPNRAYGKTKQLAERQFAAIAAEHRVEGIVARAFQHAGPRQSLRMIVPDWVDQFLRPECDPVQVINLDTWLDLSDVRDVVRAYRCLVERGQSGAVYNVGSGVSHRSGDVFDCLRRMYDPTRRVEEAMPGRRQLPVADITKITRDTAWRPEITLEQTLVDTVAWRREFLKQA